MTGTARARDLRNALQVEPWENSEGNHDKAGGKSGKTRARSSYDGEKQLILRRLTSQKGFPLPPPQPPRNAVAPAGLEPRCLAALASRRAGWHHATHNAQWLPIQFPCRVVQYALAVDLFPPWLAHVKNTLISMGSNSSSCIVSFNRKTAYVIDCGKSSLREKNHARRSVKNAPCEGKLKVCNWLTYLWLREGVRDMIKAT